MNDLENTYYCELFFFKPTFICLVSNSGLNFVTKATMGKYGVQLSYSILLKLLR